jgi:NAD(P)-dependent dehydrogenase (short-subunit alcohol dehydrogenase family)
VIHSSRKQDEGKQDEGNTNMTQIPNEPMAGKTVLVTGATGGIGRATAMGLAAMGANVAITGRDRARTEGAAREIRAAGGRQVDLFVADLSSQPEVRQLAGEMLQTYPRIDVLVNNVGATGTPGTSRPTGSSAPSLSTTLRRSC